MKLAILCALLGALRGVKSDCSARVDSPFTLVTGKTCAYKSYPVTVVETTETTVQITIHQTWTEDAPVGVIATEYFDGSMVTCDTVTNIYHTSELSYTAACTDGYARFDFFVQDASFSRTLDNAVLPSECEAYFGGEEGWDGFGQLCHYVFIAACPCETTPSPTVTTPSPTNEPTKAPVKPPTRAPVKPPTRAPVRPPTKAPVKAPTKAPVRPPTKAPIKAPTKAPIKPPTKAPVRPPTKAPVRPPTKAPIKPPTKAPLKPPTKAPVKPPTKAPIKPPTKAPVKPPTKAPLKPPTKAPVRPPTKAPIKPPTKAPIKPPTKAPIKPPTKAPLKPPTKAPVKPPTKAPIKPPTKAPLKPPTKAPVKPPTKAPVKPPTSAPVKPPTSAPVKPPTSAPVKPPTPAPVKPPTPAPINPPTSAPVVPPTPAPVAPPTSAPVNPPTSAPVKPPTAAPVKPPTSAPVMPPTTVASFHPKNSIPDKMSQVDIVRAITAKNARHDPDGVTWIKRESWLPWDGVTTYNPCKLSTQQLQAGIFPGSIHTMRGLREVFYQVKPFADNANPTAVEIEKWNVEVIRHFRRLLGFNETSHPVENDKCTYLKATWAEERARTNYWSTKYPGTLNSPAGPCTVPYSPNAHCGASFLPDNSDQAPYLEGMPTCTVTGGAEGLITTKTIPWSILMGRVIGQFLWSDGIGAHTGPFVGRSKFGSAWYMSGGDSVVMRGKWSGNLAPTCP